ncbi:unnamed protein product [Staurois parvus]|uniref:Uncharacterized protein n=1 Tax=Staurois parvus TaxID=386267 RepID=A0ABN9CL97_9NEOB|nr:unnamed protein product [Staurois parvus]
MNTLWPRFMKKDYLFAIFYKKNTYFSKFWDFFHLYSNKIKIPVVNKYHQK